MILKCSNSDTDMVDFHCMKKEVKTEKPKFQRRKSIVSEARLREIEAFGGNPIPHLDYHIILEDMLSMSIRRQGRPYPMLKLQGELLHEIGDAENSVSTYKKKLAEIKDSKEAPDSDIQFVKSELSKCRRLKYAYRDIGDGIAWRFLECDRCVLARLGVHSRKPQINIPI